MTGKHAAWVDDSGMNCSTIIVGKKASATGRVLVAHNEDDPNCFVQSHLVPRAVHALGETLTFADGTAVIPQVEETLGYYWSEFRALHGEPFADAFLNECGVLVVSNGCVGSKVPEDGSVTGGIGYGLRHLIAQRAHTAREGVEVAAALLEKFGYYSARSYQICDKEEGWVLQVTTGHNFVARRVGDDEVYYIPNWYTIHEVDFSDTQHKNFYWSKDLVNYPMSHGWYTPAKGGDFSDFDFAAVYQSGGFDIPSNQWRSDLAWRQLTGAPLPHRTFSVKAPKVYGMEELKAILRSHYDGHEEDLKTDPAMSPHRYGICRDTTVESLVVEFADDPALTCMWRAFPRPCAAPFVPWYCGMTQLPPGHEWIGPKASLASHFAVDASELAYDPQQAYWSFHLLQNIMEFDYQYCQDKVHSDIAAMEAQWAVTKPEVDEAYRRLKAKEPEAARQLLTDYTAAQAQKAWLWARSTAQGLVDSKYKSNMDFWRSKL